ncbi:MAG: hypothetical protein WBG92_24820 [Thiohalocapsa sp.]
MLIHLPSEPDSIRRVVDAWVAEQAGVLRADESAALDTANPDWRAQATQLIAEGLLAYVAIEMVAPDLAIANSNGQGRSEDSILAARLGAHMRDFVDYRAEIETLSVIKTGVQTEVRSASGAKTDAPCQACAKDADDH